MRLILALCVMTLLLALSSAQQRDLDAEFVAATPNPSHRWQVDFFVLFHSAGAANKACSELKERDGAEIDSVRETADGWACVTQEVMRLDINMLHRFRRNFERVARKYHGRYAGMCARGDLESLR